MKPIKLTMQAFGPFAGTQEIDFTQLGENPLFLINGPTGSGKTTILDGICYALYGSTTGNEREGSDMRCDYAVAGLLTQVEFEFMLGDARYNILRIPEQNRQKERGEGDTKQPAKVTLLKDQNKIKSVLGNKAGEVSKKIHELTGLNAEQFRQVMVLPQGKFREILLAKSDEREKIFATLFQTQIYQKIQDALKIKAGTIGKDFDDHKQKKLGVLQSASVENEQALAEQIASVQPVLLQIQQAKERAEKEYGKHKLALETASTLSAKFAQLSQRQDDLAACEAQQPAVDNKAGQLQQAQRADRILPLQKSFREKDTAVQMLNRKFEEHQQAVRTAQAAAATAEANLLAAQTAAEAIEPSRARLQTLEAIQPKLIELDQARQQSAQAKRQHENAGERLAQAEAQLKDNRAQQDSLQAKIQAARAEVEGEANAVTAANHATQCVQQKKDLEKLEQEASAKSTEIAKAKTSCEQQIDVVKAADKNLKQLRLQWHSNQAVLLARELASGEPCPVCGSCEHPQPAEQDAKLPLVEREQVDAAEVQLKNEGDKLTKQEKLLERCQAEAEGLQQRIGDCRQQMGEQAGVSLQQLQADATTRQAQVEALGRTKSALQSQEKQLAMLAEQAREIEQQLEGLRGAANGALAAQAKASEATRALEDAVPAQWRDGQALQAAIASENQTMKKLSEALDRAQKQLGTAKINLSAADATLAQLKTQQIETMRQAEQANSEWMAAMLANGFADEQAFASVCLTEAAQKSLQQEINAHKEKLLGLRTTLENLQADLAGKTVPDTATLQTALQLAEEAKSAAEKAWAECNSRLDALKNAQQLLEKLTASAEELEQRYKLYGTLSELANGTRGDRISLQRFVLSVLLDEVLMQATQRLLQMSKGRYHLLRTGSSVDKRRVSGLALSILDEYTGKERPVATLSGGESFMAALALALGLSDVVQAHAGGIRLDTLFIDEGFGSLDPESLDLAIRTLMDLQATGRTIGIISHVSELKEQMALRIDVSASRLGSEISISGIA